MKIYEGYGFGKYREGCGTLRAAGGDCGPGSEMLCVGRARQWNGGVCPTLTGDHENRVTDYTALSVCPLVTGALCANSHPGSYTGQDAFNDMLPVMPSTKPPRKYIVRRLTPLECCRLQGFPDCWEEGLATENPSEEDIAYWAKVFETYRRATDPSKKPKTRKRIVKWLKQPYSDSASYRMWGNGMAYPCMLHIMQGIAREHHD